MNLGSIIIVINMNFFSFFCSSKVMPDLLKGGEITEQPPIRSDYLGKGGNGSVHTTTLCNHTFAVKTIVRVYLRTF